MRPYADLYTRRKEFKKMVKKNEKEPKQEKYEISNKDFYCFAHYD